MSVKLQGLLLLPLAMVAAFALQPISRAAAADDGPRTFLVEQGDPAPDGSGGTDGQFNDFLQSTALNVAGEAAFMASLFGGPEGLGVFRSDGTTTVFIAREGDPAPDATGSFTGYFDSTLSFGPRLLIDDGGRTVFTAHVRDGSGDSLGRGVWIGDGSSLVQIIREGNTAPNGDGSFYTLSGHSLNDRGEVAVSATLRNTVSGDDESIVVKGDGSSLVRVARKGQAAPGEGSPTFVSLSNFITFINDYGQVVFDGTVELDNGVTTSGRYIGDGTSLAEIVRRGDPAPQGGTFNSFSPIEALNNAGQAVWMSTLDDHPDWKGIFRGGATSIGEIVRIHHGAPDATGAADGVFSNFGSEIRMNDAGQVIFSGWVTGSSMGDVGGLFRGDGANLIAIVREGDASPDGNGMFGHAFSDIAINAQGQVLFAARLTGTSGGTDDDDGVFLYDDAAGLVTVVREGGPFGDWVHWDFDVNRSNYTEEENGFNQFGQTAYWAEISTAIEGIALFDGGYGSDPVGPDLEMSFSPIPIIVGEQGILSATADETRTGGLPVAGIEYRVDAGDWHAVPADDAPYDEPVETGSEQITFTMAGVHELCARAGDGAGNFSLRKCVEVQVESPDPSVRLRAMEVTQTIQDWQNSIPLYRAKDTVVRVFLERLDASAPDMVTGRLHGSIDGSPLEGSPLAPEEAWLELVDDATVVDDPETDDNESVRGRIDGSLNFVLPWSWTIQTALPVELEFEITGPGDETLACAEPDGTADCTAVVQFEDTSQPEFELVAVPYNRNEIRRLEVSATGGTFVLESGGKVSDPLPFDISADDLDNAVEHVLGARNGRVLTWGDGSTYGITILRGHSETLTVDDSGLTGTATMTVIQEGGPETRPTDEHLREQAARISDNFPIMSVDRSFADLNGFDRAPTVIKVNTRLKKAHIIDFLGGDVFAQSKRLGYLLGNDFPDSTRSGQGWFRVASAYSVGAESPEDGGRWRHIGVHEAAHTFGRAHAVTRSKLIYFTSGVCGSHGHVHTPKLHPWVEDTGWKNDLVTDFYSSTEWPTIGPLSNGPDEEVWGFSPRAYANGEDFEHLVVVDPWKSAALMSYCNPPGARQDLWASKLTYDVLYQRINGGALRDADVGGRLADGEYVVVTGSIDPDTGNAEIDPVVRLEGSDPGYEAGNVHVALVDDSGAELAARDVLLLQDGNQESLSYGSGPLGQGFFAPLRVPDGSRPSGIEVSIDDVQLGVVSASPNPPTVAISSPSQGIVVTDPINVEWNASDVDGDRLVATVMYSTDDGATWKTLAVDHEGSSYDAPTRFLRGSSQARIRVQVSDGFHTADAVSDPFTVDAGNPVASIGTPAGSQRTLCRGPLRLRGDAWDPEDGMLSGTALQWLSDLDGVLGTGERLTIDIDSLSLGWSVITLTATDSDGRTDSESVDVYLGTSGCTGVIFADGFESDPTTG